MKSLHPTAWLAFVAFALAPGGAAATTSLPCPSPPISPATVLPSIQVGPGHVHQVEFDISLDPPDGADFPRAAAFTADGERVLVANFDSDNLSVIDFATRAVVALIPVGDGPVDVEVSPDGSTAAVSNSRDQSVTFVDLASLSSTATVALTPTVREGRTGRLTFGPGGERVYVSLFEAQHPFEESRISVIDTATATETLSFPVNQIKLLSFSSSIFFEETFDSTDWCLAPDESCLLVGQSFPGDTAILRSYDPATGQELASVSLNSSIVGIDISRDSSAAIVSGRPFTLTAFDLNGGVPVSTGSVALASFPAFFGARISPDGTEAIVGSAVSQSGSTILGVEYVDLATLTSSGFVPIPASQPGFSLGTLELLFSFDDQYLLFTGPVVGVVRLSDKAIVAEVPLTSPRTFEFAASPVSHRLVGLRNQDAEDVLYVSTDGSSSQELGQSSTGPGPEVDVPIFVETSPDGRFAFVAGDFSRVIGQVDLFSQEIVATYPCGEWVTDLACDGAVTVAVAASRDSRTVQVLDLQAGALAAEFSTLGEPLSVEVTNDGARAFVLTGGRDLAGTPSNQLLLVDLAGSSSAVSGTVPLGQVLAGSTGMALSPDESLLAVCNAALDELLLLDTSTGLEFARIPMSNTPFRVAWSSDGGRAYVTSTEGTVSRVEVSGGGALLTAILPLPAAATIDVGPDDEYLYVGTRLFQQSSTITVVDAATMTVVLSQPVGQDLFDQERFGRQLIVAAKTDIIRLELDGPNTFIANAGGAGTRRPFSFAFSQATGFGLSPQFTSTDRLAVVRFGGPREFACFGAPNSTGVAAELDAIGALLAGGLPLTLRATHMPPFQFGLLLASRDTGFAPNPGGSQGNLCLGGEIGRFINQIDTSDAAGTLSIAVDTNAIPAASTLATAATGDSWSFQIWYRDVNPLSTSNLTNRVTALFY